MIKERIKIVIPGDDPPQIQDSTHLERLKAYGDLTLYTDRPKDRMEKIARVIGAEIIMNTRSNITWGHVFERNEGISLHEYARLKMKEKQRNRQENK